MTKQGFKKGQSDNLCRIDSFMVAEYLGNSDNHVRAEMKNVKAERSGRESYGDSAVGYVQVRRVQSLCTVKGRVCPEHRVRAKGYSVTLTLDEENEKIISVECHDCAASVGGCKHSIAFLMWLHRRSEEPACTSVQCYWKKCKLATVGTGLKFIEVKEFNKEPLTQEENDVENDFLREVIEEGTKRSVNSQLIKHFSGNPQNPAQGLSMHSLISHYKQSENLTYQNFLNTSRVLMSESLCHEAASLTQGQADNKLWYELRYGRITASKIYKAARCKTLKGSLVEAILGAKKIKDTEAMQRGRTLEKEVIEVVANKIKKKLRREGLLLNPKWPMLGASPDAVGDDVVVEVKCPTSEKSVQRYVNNGKINPKFLAQINLQMLMAGKQKGYFCIADHTFESTRQVTTYMVNYDQEFIEQIIEDGIHFWKKAVFPILLKGTQ